MNELSFQKENGNSVQPATGTIPRSSAAMGEYMPLDLRSSLRMFRAQAEVHAISRALEYTGWNRKRAAQLLRISYRGLLYKIRQHNITPADRVPLSSFEPRLKTE